MNYRMLPPTAPAMQTRTVNGRTYNGSPGQVFDIPDSDADALGANGWIRVMEAGPTAQRPTGTAVPGGPGNVAAGAKYFDTDVGALIVFDGKTWRNPLNGNAV